MLDDGGKMWMFINIKCKYVDDYVMVFYFIDLDFVLMGFDGGIYMFYDRMVNWCFMVNFLLI